MALEEELPEEDPVELGELDDDDVEEELLELEPDESEDFEDVESEDLALDESELDELAFALVLLSDSERLSVR